MKFIRSAIGRVTGSAPGWLNVAQREEALKRAYLIVAQHHPQAMHICFDWHFLQTWAEYLFRPFFDEGIIPDPKALAGAWAEQFAVSHGWKQDAFRDVLPMATDLIYVLEAEVESTVPSVGIQLEYAM